MAGRSDTNIGPMSRRPSDLTPSSSRVIRSDSDKADRLYGLINERDAAIIALEYEVQRLSNELQSHTKIVKREHPLEPVINEVGNDGTTRTFMGRHASMATANALRSFPLKEKDKLAQKMIGLFKNPKAHAEYLTSQGFAKDLIRLCKRISPIFEEEPRCVFIQSPVYVFGDIHGNLEDLHFFADNIWKLGMHLTSGKFLFLGDYVDRGLLGLETLAYLFSLKIENPTSLFMLRGNHELRDVNGWVEYYREKSFLWQCQHRFGNEMGEHVWEECNSVFDRLPLAAVIDNDLFCVHGGIPRPLAGSSSRIQDIMSVPAVAGICPANQYETFESQQVASDCLWSDPAKDNQEMELDATGFGSSLRGGGAICFGARAIQIFLQEAHLSYIVRAHEAHSEGVSLCKGATVFTVFSTSKDHGQGKTAMCGCILVDFDKIQVINRSPKYKQRYIHRHDSVSLRGISPDNVKRLVKVGLVGDNPDQFYSSVGADDEDDGKKSKNRR